MTLRRDTLRRAAAALLTLSAAGAAVATVDAIARAPTLALWETVAPEAMGPEALRLHIDSLLAETVDAAWLEAETEAALAETPPAWGRLDALEALAAERGLALPPALAARRAAAMADRPSAIGACLGGLTAAALPDDATAIGCYFGAALTPVGDVKALGVEGARAMRGEEPDWTTVSLAGVGVGALALGPAGLPARYAVATLRTARKLGALSAGLAAEIADIGRRVVRFDRAAAPADWVDPGALRALGAPVMDIGRVARSAGSVTAVRALRHVETLDDAARLRRVSAAAGPRTGPALDALGLRRIFAPVTRLTRAGLEVWGLAAGALAQLGLAALALGKWGAGRLLRPARA